MSYDLTLVSPILMEVTRVSFCMETQMKPVLSINAILVSGDV